ncbi:L-xylulose reductase-like [Chrysoperla carnea]|uniref:L-xylulose reductase-like n=1 Tax=Chrysoperla carnea TaxID=189513 RepID=UPI001D098802|nr:L-xylulose reductase-like [Chrysoperla carnea]
MNISFRGKRIMVTGAERGIGREIVRQLVACEAEVIAVSLNLSELEKVKNEHPSIEIISTDLSNWTQTKNALKNVRNIDGLVNNAGIAILDNFLNVTESSFDLTFNINVKAVVNVSQIAAQDMIDRKSGGSIVNISSQASKVGLKDHTVYCGSKSAVDGITRVMALELGPHNIRVNCLNPTVVMTELGRAAWSDPVKAGDMLNKIPLGRFCEIEDVVNAVLFLLSHKATMINGVTLPVDGGFLAC